MRWLSLWFVIAVGCIKPRPVPQAPSPTPVAVATVLESTEAPGLQPVPDAVSERLARELSSRGLVPQPSVDTQPLDTRHSTHSRMTWLAQTASGAGLLLLVETEARFSVQVNGRYRWNVDATITLAPPHEEAEGLTASLSVPVALVYSHQTQADALTEAAPLIARRLGVLLDDWIANSPP